MSTLNFTKRNLLVRSIAYGRFKDPHYANVSLLLRGTYDGSLTVFKDDGPDTRSPTLYGNATLSTTAKFGSHGMYFDGSGDYARCDGSADFAFGTGDFTIEFWIRRAVVGVQQCPFRLGTSGLTTPGILIQNDNKVKWWGASALITSTTTLAVNTWYHIAVCRASGSTKLFVNGIQEGSTYADSNNYTVGTNYPVIGADESLSSSFLSGSLDDYRITKGVARYTANFVVPSETLPAL